MKYRYLLYIFIIFLSPASFAQEFAYVNTDNLILRDRPEKTYRVQAILHAPAEVEVQPYLRQYKNNKKVTDRFYRVKFIYRRSGTADLTIWYGWIEKKYMVSSVGEVTYKEINTSTADVIYTIPYIGADEHDPNKQNRTGYPYPKYKGGEMSFDVAPTTKRVYHRGARGGCYYITTKGAKRYVDTSKCKKRA